MHKSSVYVLVISISSPILIGIYDKEYNLIKKYESSEKTTEILPKLFKEILDKYSLKKLFFVNGPGSYMAIKINYLFLKTLSIVYDIELLATSGFYFNQNTPIKALGKKYFYQDNKGKVYIDLLNNNKIEDFVLPANLDISIFSNDNLPSYNLPAVQN